MDDQERARLRQLHQDLFAQHVAKTVERANAEVIAARASAELTNLEAQMREITEKLQGTFVARIHDSQASAPLQEGPSQ